MKQFYMSSRLLERTSGFNLVRQLCCQHVRSLTLRGLWQIRISQVGSAPAFRPDKG
ncbi:hypothetical protein HBH52_227130 [Parastagonospora nodorum]|nr:hypothetical protein HBH52_227130 [Parastagonospora nodorum]